MHGFNLISQIRIQIGKSLWKLSRTTLYSKQSLLCSSLRLLGALLSFENLVMGFLQLPKACLLMLNPFHYNKTFHSVQLVGIYVAIWLLFPALVLGTHDIVVHFCLVLIVKLQCLCVNRSYQFCHFKLVIHATAIENLNHLFWLSLWRKPML